MWYVTSFKSDLAMNSILVLHELLLCKCIGIGVWQFLLKTSFLCSAFLSFYNLSLLGQSK